MFVHVTGAEIDEKEQQAYIDMGVKKYGAALEGVNIRIDGDTAELTWHLTDKPFERIRRITGYLVGTMERWNNAKRAEEGDRVKHGEG